MTPLLMIKRKFADQILSGQKRWEYRKKPLKPGCYTLFAGRKLGDVKIIRVVKIESNWLAYNIWLDLHLCYGSLPKFLFAHEIEVDREAEIDAARCAEDEA